MSVVVRTARDQLALAADARQVVRAIDREQPVANVRTLSGVMAAALSQPKFNALLLSAFAGLAGLLAVVGVYGVMSYSVSHVPARRAMGIDPMQALRAE